MSYLIYGLAIIEKKFHKTYKGFKMREKQIFGFIMVLPYNKKVRKMKD